MAAGESGLRVVFLGSHKQPSYVVEAFSVPDEDDIKDDEILVKMRLASICPLDISCIDGEGKQSTPCVLGHEGVGEVVVSHQSCDASLALKKGDRVTFAVEDSCTYCQMCKDGLQNKCGKLVKYGHTSLNEGTGLHGAFSTYIVLRKGTKVVKVPENVSDNAVTPSNCALAMMINAIDNLPPLQPSSREAVAVVQGANLHGLYGCALLHESGYMHVYCYDTCSDRLRFVSKFGGIPVFVGRNSDIRINGRPAANSVDIVLEVSGKAEALPIGISLLRPGGTYILVGIPKRDITSHVSVDPIVQKCISVKGICSYKPKHLEAAVNFLSRTVCNYPYDALISPPFPIQEFHSAVCTARVDRYYRVCVNLT